MKTLVPLTAPLAARALVVIAYFCLHLVRFAASSCRYRMRSALSLAEPTHGGRFLFMARLAGGWSGLVLMHLGRGAFGKALFADPCGALGHAAVEINRMDMDQLMLILRLY